MTTPQTTTINNFSNTTFTVTDIPSLLDAPGFSWLKLESFDLLMGLTSLAIGIFITMISTMSWFYVVLIPEIIPYDCNSPSMIEMNAGIPGCSVAVAVA